MGTCVSRQGGGTATASPPSDADNRKANTLRSQLEVDKEAKRPYPGVKTAPEKTPTGRPRLSLKRNSLSGEQRVSPSSSPCPTFLSVSTEGPFTGYNPSAWYATSSGKWEAGHSDDQGSPTTFSDQYVAAHRKSASIGILERISKERESRRSTAVDRNEDYLPQSQNDEVTVDSARKSLSAPTRRLSSKFNDIPTQLERFLPRGEDEPMTLYLHRVFDAVDEKKKGAASIGEIVGKVFPSSERDSVRTMLNAADSSTEGDLTAEQFVKFFVHLSEDDCMSPEVDMGVGGDGDPMGLSPSECALACPSNGARSNRLPSMSVKLLYDGTAEVCTDTKGPSSLRDVRVRPLAGQAERIKCIAVSPDPRIYAVAHRHDRVAHIYTSQGNEVRRLAGHGDSLLGIAFSPDRKYVATVSRDKLLMVWDCTVGLECHSIEHPGIVTAVAFAFDAKCVYTGCQDNITRKISFPKGRLRATIPELPNTEGGVIVSVSTQHLQNSLVVFSRSCDEHAYVAHAENLSLCMQLNGHESLVWQTAFSSNDDYILTCCERKIIVWRTADFSPIGDFDASASSTLCRSGDDSCLWTTAVFGPFMYRSLVFAFNTQGEMLVLDMETPENGAMMDVRLRSSVYAASTSSNSNYLVCGDDLGNVYQLLMS